ncbi:MAG: hypothetical protein D6806_07775 [Deltaproteobacteria bacterium]|nr:MAG: hypothetical protein D6806_07775 [Deltaproteobacteria bacterium]
MEASYVIFAVVVALSGIASETVLLDEVVATVDTEVITRSEVEAEARLIMLQRFGPDALSREPSADLLSQVLRMLINHKLMATEALRIGLPPLGDAERKKLLQGFKMKFRSEDEYLRFLYRYGFTDEQVAEVLARHVWIERLKKRKLSTLKRIGDGQIRAYYRKHRAELGGKPLQLVYEAIRLKLLSNQRQKFLSDWLWKLRRQHTVRVLVDFGTGKTAEP